MSDILERIAELEPASNLAWLKDIQVKGQPAWRDTQWPNRKTEDWKYTNLRAIESGEFFFSCAESQEGVDHTMLKKHFEIDGLSTYSLVFLNGEFNSSLSNVGELPSGVELVRFDEASPAQIKIIQSYFDSIVDGQKHLFAAVNNHFLQNGIFLDVSKNVVVDKPIQIAWLTTQQNQSFQVAQRMLALIGENAEVTLIEQFVSNNETQNSLTNGVTELYLDNSARLHHYRLHQEGQGAFHIGGVHATLKRNAYLNSFHMALGSELKRIDVVVNHDGEGANCIMNGVYLPQQDQHIDYHTCIEHRVPHCTTSENFRGIIGGNGRAVFNGRIHIHRDAQKTLAELSNKNLLTSTKAEVDTKPELEIYADDVQCAHGTTVAQLDDAAVHYMQTRGISKADAEVMLSFGFIKEIINTVHHSALIDYLTPLLAQTFANDPNLKSLNLDKVSQ